MTGAIGMMLGCGGASPVNFGPNTCSTAVASPGVANTSISFNPDGSITGTGVDTSFAAQFMSTVGGTVGANASVRATLSSGVNPATGTMGSWQLVNVTRTWTQVRNTFGTNTSQVLYEISMDGGSTVAASGTLTQTCQRTS